MEHAHASAATFAVDIPDKQDHDAEDLCMAPTFESLPDLIHSTILSKLSDALDRLRLCMASPAARSLSKQEPGVCGRLVVLVDVDGVAEPFPATDMQLQLGCHDVIIDELPVSALCLTFAITADNAADQLERLLEWVDRRMVGFEAIYVATPGLFDRFSTVTPSFNPSHPFFHVLVSSLVQRAGRRQYRGELHIAPTVHTDPITWIPTFHALASAPGPLSLHLVLDFYGLGTRELVIDTLRQLPSALHSLRIKGATGHYPEDSLAHLTALTRLSIARYSDADVSPNPFTHFGLTALRSLEWMAGAWSYLDAAVVPDFSRLDVALPQLAHLTELALEFVPAPFHLQLTCLQQLLQLRSLRIGFPLPIAADGAGRYAIDLRLPTLRLPHVQSLTISGELLSESMDVVRLPLHEPVDASAMFRAFHCPALRLLDVSMGSELVAPSAFALDVSEVQRFTSIVFLIFCSWSAQVNVILEFRDAISNMPRLETFEIEGFKRHFRLSFQKLQQFMERNPGGHLAIEPSCVVGTNGDIRLGWTDDLSLGRRRRDSSLAKEWTNPPFSGFEMRNYRHWG